MGQRFEDRSRELRQDPVQLELGWKAAFRIAWAIVIVQFAVAVLAFLVFLVFTVLVAGGVSELLN